MQFTILTIKDFNISIEPTIYTYICIYLRVDFLNQVSILLLNLFALHFLCSRKWKFFWDEHNTLKKLHVGKSCFLANFVEFLKHHVLNHLVVAKVREFEVSNILLVIVFKCCAQIVLTREYDSHGLLSVR